MLKNNINRSSSSTDEDLYIRRGENYSCKQKCQKNLDLDLDLYLELDNLDEREAATQASLHNQIHSETRDLRLVQISLTDIASL